MTGNASRVLLGIALVVLLVTAAGSQAVAAQPTECMNADRGPGEDGPPGFVGSLVPDFLSELIGSLPVPNFVKSFFGASTC